jgi:hypothetical protein
MSNHKGDSDTGGAPLSGESYSSFPTSGDPLGLDEAKALDAEPFDAGEWESQSNGGEV